MLNIYIIVTCVERKREEKKERYTHIKKISKYMEKHIYIYTCREVYCKCAELDLSFKNGRWAWGEGAAPPPKAE